MNIKILSDSTCDLGPELLEQHDITPVPLVVVREGKEYRDGVTITPEDIFDHVAAGGALCSTAAVSIGEYEDFFGRYAGEYDAVIHISLGSGFSTCYQSACLAAEAFDNVFVIDSKNLSTGQGLVVLKARELALEGLEPGELVETLNAYTEKVESSFLVDKLEYLVKGGRCSSAAALGANLLNLKPCIEVKEGKMSVGKKYRGQYAKCLAGYIRERLADREDIDTSLVFITRTRVSDDCYDAALEALKSCNVFDTIHETTAGCTISCHCGPGTLGILFARK